jgi:2-methylaconitate cis-trans-isomerase PrpF
MSTISSYKVSKPGKVKRERYQDPDSFAVPVDGDELDFSGNCGNMASGVGPFAVE